VPLRSGPSSFHSAPRAGDAISVKGPPIGAKVVPSPSGIVPARSGRDRLRPMVLRLLVAAVLASAAHASAADRVCGRVVAVSCSQAGTVRFSVDSSPFVDPVYVEVTVTDAERALASQLLEHKVCATGESSRRDSHRVLTIAAMPGVEIKSRPGTSPALPAGMFSPCDPGRIEPNVNSTLRPVGQADRPPGCRCDRSDWAHTPQQDIPGDANIMRDPCPCKQGVGSAHTKCSPCSGPEAWARSMRAAIPVLTAR
jgi:hypothetical protein